MFTKAHVEKIQNMADLMTQIQKQIPEASNTLTFLSLTKGSISQDLTADSLAEAIPSSALWGRSQKDNQFWMMLHASDWVMSN